MKIKLEENGLPFIDGKNCYYKSKITKCFTKIEVQEIVIYPSYIFKDHGIINISSYCHIVSTNGVRYNLEQVFFTDKNIKP